MKEFDLTVPPAETWFFGDATQWTLPAWLPTAADTAWLHTCGIDSL